MTFSTKTLSQTVTHLCLAKGIDHIVISPGSRNAPLTLGFTGQPEFHNFSIVDERCAAFFALGLAQQLGRPVAVVCTSGSALLNYYPAIAEAFYSDIPLVVLSADRPEHLIDVGDGQTIRQKEVYANHILYSANCKEGDDYQEFNETQINGALNAALEQNGPVHINLPFSEPLYETRSTAEVVPTNSPPRVSSEGFTDSLTPLIKNWNRSERKMVLVGVLPPKSIESEVVKHLGADESVIVFTETTSNLHHEQFFPSIDQMIAPLDDNDFKDLQPEVLLTFGGMVVSKKIKAFLRAYPPKYHYHVDPKRAMDTFFCLTQHIKKDVNSLFNILLTEFKEVKSDYRKYWLTLKSYRLKRHESYMEQISFTDFLVVEQIVAALPQDIQLQLANSATVRYSQLFSLHPSLHVFCNRGTSGIDGSTSTAIGAAVASTLPTIFITGDLSFFYDSNALWNDYIPANFRIIILNNGGGGIFRILPGNKDSKEFSTYFETKHELTASQLAKMYGFKYKEARDVASLKDALNGYFKNTGAPKILEVFTPSEENDTVLLEYFNFLK